MLNFPFSLFLFASAFHFWRKMYFHVTPRLTSCKRTCGDFVRSCRLCSSRFVVFYQYTKISCFSHRRQTLGSEERHSSNSESRNVENKPKKLGQLFAICCVVFRPIHPICELGSNSLILNSDFKIT